MTTGSGNINFSSQRISFVNKIGLILKATSNDEQPTAGYLFKEINEISFESVGYSESLVEFLVDRLKNKSCHVKFKVLKLMKHLVDNGSKDFVLGLRKHSDGVKECTKFGGPPHPMHGNVPYVMVRKIAAEVCECLYRVDHFQSAPKVSKKTADPKYGGMGPVGPVRSGGAIQGFGNSPNVHSKGIGETILGEIEKLSTKISETPSDRQAALLAKLDLSGSVSNYQPPVVSCETVPTVVSPSARDQTHNALTSSIIRTVKKPQQGKAGGGWSDDDDEDDERDLHGSGSQHSFETDSLADPSLRLAPEDAAVVWQAESDLVLETTQTGTTGQGKALLAPSDLDSFRVKATHLNCDKLVEEIASKLTNQNAGLVLRCLQLLETILYAPEELMGLELLTSTCRHALVDCYTHCDLDPNLGHDLERDSIPAASPGLWVAVKAKCAKIIFILQALSSQKEIISSSRLRDFLPIVGQPVAEPLS